VSIEVFKVKLKGKHSFVDIFESISSASINRLTFLPLNGLFGAEQTNG
jgi:hypothetical protein